MNEREHETHNQIIYIYIYMKSYEIVVYHSLSFIFIPYHSIFIPLFMVIHGYSMLFHNIP